MLDYSRRFKTENKKLKITPPERAMADLISLGWNPQDAYIAMNLYKPALSDEYNKEQIEKMITDSDFQEYNKKREKSIRRGVLKQSIKDVNGEEEEDDINLIDKEAVLKEILRSALSLPQNDPNRAKMLMQYAELQQMKKEEVETEDTTVHYYLPLSCNNCSLYQNLHKKSKPH